MADMAYISRSAWGARAPKRALSSWSSGKPTSWTLHYEGKNVPIDRDRAYYDAHARAIQAWHMDHSPEGYIDIAYNFLISPIGDIYEGRGWAKKSGAQGSIGNSQSVAAMYMGGPQTHFTDKAQNATKWLIAQRPMDVHPHNFWMKTPCPGPYVKAWINLGQPAGKKCYCPPKPKVQRTFRVGPTLQRGNKGVSVKTLQNRLNLVTGARLKVDGDFGGLTYRAVKNFQHFFKMTVDGIVGPKTWGALNYFYAVKGGR